jgi:hypothetical protein
LEQAAAGVWEPFFRVYLAPCWREVVIACRQDGWPTSDARDKFQELVLRLLREGGFRGDRTAARPLGAKESGSPKTAFRGNVPAKYLASLLGRPEGTARFRTYLKSVIDHVVRSGRRRRRKEQPLPDSVELVPALWVEPSVGADWGRQWLTDCLNEAAHRMKSQCAVERTKGRMRWFELMYRSWVLRQKSEHMARELGVERTTISEQLVQAKRQFRAILTSLTDLEEAELRPLESEVPGALRSALERAWNGDSHGDTSP